MNYAPARPWWLRWLPRGRTGVISIPYLWLMLFFLIPFVIVLKIAFSDSRIGMPPYEPLLQWAGEQIVQIKLNLANFAFLIEDSLYWKAYLTSIWVAFVSTVFCLLIGYSLTLCILLFLLLGFCEFCLLFFFGRTGVNII